MVVSSGLLSYTELGVIRNLQDTGQEKQKMLLSAETGHFSMLRSVSCDSGGAELAVRDFAHIEFCSTGPYILQTWLLNSMVSFEPLFYNQK